MFRKLTWTPLFKRVFFYRRPSPPEDVIVANRTLSWNLPVPTATQAALSHVLVDQRVDPQFPWTNIANIPVSQPQTLTLPDVNPGTIYYRVIVVDVQNQQSTPVEATGNLAFDPPSPVTNLTIVDG